MDFSLLFLWILWWGLTLLLLHELLFSWLLLFFKSAIVIGILIRDDVCFEDTYIFYFVLCMAGRYCLCDANV